MWWMLIIKKLGINVLSHSCNIQTSSTLSANRLLLIRCTKRSSNETRLSMSCMKMLTSNERLPNNAWSKNKQSESKVMRKFNLLKKCWKTTSAAVLCCLVGLLTSCASKPDVEYRTLVLSPPVTLLTPCLVPAFQGATFGETVEYALLLKQELRLCANKVDGVREYVEKQQRKRP